MTPQKRIRLEGLKQNNLKNITVEVPLRSFNVITGLSGSGKSSLAFESLYAEGQRRYIESLSTYTRQFLEKMPKPDVEKVVNIPPSIALEQRNHVVNSRSIVGTQTEIADFLRVLFSKIGLTECIDCNGQVKKLDAESISAIACEMFFEKRGAIAAPIYYQKPKKVKKTKKKKTKKKPAPTSTLTPRAALKALFQLLTEQGFQRLAHKPKGKKVQIFQLDEMGEIGFSKLPIEDFENENVFVVLDRIKISDLKDKETLTRIQDSIEQSLKVGHGRLALIDMDSGKLKRFNTTFACVECGRVHRTPEPNLFSFNSPIGACSDCSGFGFNLEIDESLVVPEPHRTLKNGAVDPFTKPSLLEWQEDMFRFAERHSISIGKRYCDLKQTEKKLLWEGDPNDNTFPGILGCFKELEGYKYKLHIRVFIRRYQSQSLCQTCSGSRLSAEAMAVKIHGKKISDLLALPIDEALQWFQKIKLKKHEVHTAKNIFEQVLRRLAIMDEVGVGYLTLSRMTKTLSGGEFQRINLATQLGSGLCGTLYVLDEPSIGLHAADTERLIEILKKLRDQGNTLVVVEHDLDVMRAADWIVELGPGAGFKGGDLVAMGTPKDVMAEKGSITGKYLRGDFTIPIVRKRRGPALKTLKITNCKENNLKNITVEFPLERLVVVTGVSGSGKTTLVHKTLYNALDRVLVNPLNRSTSLQKQEGGRFGNLYGVENLSGIVLLDQKPIGKSSRSNPATYLKAWDEVRKIFANQVMSIRRGYKPQFFSFNVDGGRCPICKGEGEITVDMHFLAEVTVPCEECNGRRFKREILDVKYRSHSIYDMLKTTIDEAYDIFRDNPVLNRKFSILRDVGLGYLQVGQSATTLSGGESQRLKIASVLEERHTRKMLYIFDEPTTGLHQEDVKRLLMVIQDLVDARNSVILIEHHLDLIAQADWVIDLGPEGGKRGGDLIAAGTPLDIINTPQSATGKILTSHHYDFSKENPRIL